MISRARLCSERAEEADRKMTAAAKRMRAAADEAEATAQTLHRRVSGLTWGLTILFASAAVIAGLVGGFVAGWLMMR